MSRARKDLTRLMTRETALACIREATRLGAFLHARADRIEIYPDGGGDPIAELHPDLDGRWVLASWNGKAYVSQSPPGRIEGGVIYRYTYARTLRALRKRGAPAFSSAAAALASMEAP